MLDVKSGHAKERLSSPPTSHESIGYGTRLAAEEARRRDRALRRQRIRMLLQGDPAKNRQQQMSNPNLIATPQEMEFVCNLRTRQLKNMNSPASSTPGGCPEAGPGSTATGLLRTQSLGAGWGGPTWADLPNQALFSPLLPAAPSGPFPKSSSRRERPSTAQSYTSSPSALQEARPDSRISRSNSLERSPSRNSESNQASKSTGLGSGTQRHAPSKPAAGPTTAERAAPTPSGLSRSRSLDPNTATLADVRLVLRQHRQSFKSLSVGSPPLHSGRCPAPRIPRTGASATRVGAGKSLA